MKFFSFFNFFPISRLSLMLLLFLLCITGCTTPPPPPLDTSPSIAKAMRDNSLYYRYNRNHPRRYQKYPPYYVPAPRYPYYDPEADNPYYPYRSYPRDNDENYTLPHQYYQYEYYFPGNKREDPSQYPLFFD